MFCGILFRIVLNAVSTRLSTRGACGNYGDYDFQLSSRRLIAYKEAYITRGAFIIVLLISIEAFREWRYAVAGCMLILVGNRVCGRRVASIQLFLLQSS